MTTPSLQTGTSGRKQAQDQLDATRQRTGKSLVGQDRAQQEIDCSSVTLRGAMKGEAEGFHFGTGVSVRLYVLLYSTISY